MAEIHIPAPGRDERYWSDHMGQMLREVVQDWVNRAEGGDASNFFGTNDPTTIEHLRVAKAFVDPPVRIADPELDDLLTRMYPGEGDPSSERR